MLKCFNAADPSIVSGVRATSIVPAQALLLMNSGFVMEQALGFAKRLLGNADTPVRAETSNADMSVRLTSRINRAWRMAFTREPTDAEHAALRQALASAPGSEEAWAQVCQVLFQCGEFQTIY